MSHPPAKYHYRVLWLTTPILAVVSILATTPQVSLEYRDRGDRYEGIKSFPMADKPEILSAIVDYKEPASELPDYVKLKFYLNENLPVFVTIRELTNRHNYWLDNIRNAKGWHTGFGNEFQWPTSEVIKPLKIINLYDLGAIVQLRNSSSEPEMQVAPAVLFHTQPPKTADAYLFSFKVSRKANVTWKVSTDKEPSRILESSWFSMPGHIARAIRWNAANSKDGNYQLRITIIFSSNGQQVERVIHFYHHSKVSD